jgi:branched-subunit amino acid ABC-type transport system permease component
MGKTNVDRGRWIGVPVRVVAMTFLLTVLSFAVALLLSILGTVVYSQVKHVAPNLTFAYRHVAFPVAIVAGAMVLVVSIGMEIRNYRRGKMLERIEGASFAGRQ